MNEAVAQWWWASPVPTPETLQLWVVVAVLVLAWGLSASWSRRVRGLAVVPPTVLGLLAAGRALQTPWLADDAYITFRYAANWARGLGPVWNVGERVEGYTNPLWMALLALGEWLGAPAPWLAPALNVMALVALVAGCWWGLRKAFPSELVVPVLPIVLALSPATREFGTSGLETLPATAAVTFAALTLLLGGRARTAGALVCLAALLRPDHALFFAPLGIAVITTGSVSERLGRAFELAPAALLFAAFWLLRWRWYGDFYPNTYYAKSAAIPYWSQGSVYVAEFVASTRVWWPVALAPVAALVLWVMSRRREVSRPRAPRSLVPFFVFTVGGGLLWLVYVARVGGDFMEFRFALTALPLLGLAAEVLLWARWRAPVPARLAASFVALLPLAQAHGLIQPLKKTEHIALESSFYPVKTWDPLVLDTNMFHQARSLAASKPPSAMMAVGCVGMVGYYNLDVPIFDTYGKASREVAHRPVKKRGRPGHEKSATFDDLRRAGVVWSLDPPRSAFDQDTRVSFPDGQAWLLQLDPALLSWAQARGRAINPNRLLNMANDVDAVVEHFDMLELLFSTDPGLLDAKLSALGVVSPRTLTCDVAGRVCDVSLDCEDSLVELVGDEACVLSVAGGAASRRAQCDGLTKVSVACPEEPRSAWVLTRTPARMSARVLAARTQGARAVANALRSGGAPSARVWSLDFEAAAWPAAVGRSGDAMTATAGTAPGQTEVFGFHGKSLLNTFARGDAAQGELATSLRLDSAGEHVVSLWLGGGSDCSRVYFELVVDGVSKAKVCGIQDERLRQHAWLIPAGAQEVTLRLVDASTGGWGHLLADDIEVWRLP